MLPFLLVEQTQHSFLSHLSFCQGFLEFSIFCFNFIPDCSWIRIGRFGISFFILFWIFFTIFDPGVWSICRTPTYPFFLNQDVLSSLPFLILSSFLIFSSLKNGFTPSTSSLTTFSYLDITFSMIFRRKFSVWPSFFSYLLKAFNSSSITSGG